MIPESYRHSGQAPIGGLILSMGATIVCSLILGVVYAFAVSWIPVVQLSAIATCALGGAIGGIAGMCARLGKTRNGAVIPFFSVMGAGVALWMSWVFDAKARFGMDEGPLLLDPGALMGYVQLFYNEGFWSMGKGGGATVSGIPLLIIWVIEGGTILGISFVVARSIIGAIPFCEACDQWTTKTEAFCRFRLPEDFSPMLQQIKEGDLSSLNPLEVCIGDTDRSLRVDVCRCSNCEESTYATINSVRVSVNGKGETSVQLVPVVTQGKVSPEEFRQLQTIRESVHKPDLTNLTSALMDSAK